MKKPFLWCHIVTSGYCSPVTLFYCQCPYQHTLEDFIISGVMKPTFRLVSENEKNQWNIARKYACNLSREYIKETEIYPLTWQDYWHEAMFFVSLCAISISVLCIFISKVYSNITSTECHYRSFWGLKLHVQFN